MSAKAGWNCASSAANRRGGVEPRDVEQGRQQVLDGDETALDTCDELTLAFGHLVAVFGQQRSKQFCGIQRLQQVVRGGREKTCLGHVCRIGLGFGVAERQHRLPKLRGTILDPLFEHGFGLDQCLLGGLELGDVGKGCDVAALRHRLPANLDDTAVDERTLVPVGCAVLRCRIRFATS